MIAGPLTAQKTGRYTGSLPGLQRFTAFRGFCVRGMRMRKVSSHAGAWALVVGLAIAVSGCGQIGALKAQMAFKEANQLYQRQQYKDAAAKYEEAIMANPELGEAYFYLGNSYDNQYRPARRGEASNDQLMEKAITNYKIAAERSTNPVVKQRALQFLVSAYGSEKLNDPSQQEPI